MSIKYGFIVILLLLSFNSISQTWENPYTQYSKSEGFPSNIIYSLTTDSNGVLWLGTDAGVVRFDGTNIKIFTTEDGLPTNDIFELYCDSKNRIWLSTFKNEVTYIRNNKIYNKSNDTLIRKIKPQGNLPLYFEDSRHILWISTTKMNVFTIDSSNKLQNWSNLFLQFVNWEHKSERYNISELNH